MSFDSNTLPRIIDTAAGNVLLGLREENPSAVDQVCTVIEKSALTGQFQFLDSAESLPRATPGKKPGENTSFANTSLSTQNYDMLTYKKGHRFLDEEMEDLGQYMDVVATHMPILYSYCETGLTQRLLVVLQAETRNQAAQNGAWDVETSTPVEDQLLGLRTYVPGADMCIIGANTADDLKLHTDYKEAVSFYAGRGSLGSDEALCQVIKNVLNVKECHVLRQKYNTANEGQTSSVGYVFGDWFWLGFKSNLILTKQAKTDGATLTWRDDDVGSTNLSYRRVAAIDRPSIDGGVEFTGVGT